MGAIRIPIREAISFMASTQVSFWCVLALAYLNKQVYTNERATLKDPLRY